jgi:two-component system nitrogen regulation sensor histidine kinase NtrY
MRRGVGQRIAIVLFVMVLAFAAVVVVLARVLGSVLPAAGLSVLLFALPIFWIVRSATHRLRVLLRAMNSVIASYRDGDFNVSLTVSRDDEFGELLAAHNELGSVLRDQRVQLAQRELLLSTIVENSPVALVLVDAQWRVAFGNLTARHLFNAGRRLDGEDFRKLLDCAPAALRAAVIDSSGDSLFSTEIDGVQETFHLSRCSVLLQGRPHRLLQLKRLTRELSRQEVSIWKRLIRVLSHELNNSLAPIVSLAQTGTTLLTDDKRGKLPGVLGAIGERAEHLHRFISGYATFARLPAARPETVDWKSLADDIVSQQTCRVPVPLPCEAGWLDRVQVEQALINLLKNAHESGSPAGEVELAIRIVAGEQRLEVRDRGTGMSDVVLGQALLPFYSTKRHGTGLGLALVREIAEAHGGRVHLANREGGGLCVTMILPLCPVHSRAGASLES